MGVILMAILVSIVGVILVRQFAEEVCTFVYLGKRDRNTTNWGVNGVVVRPLAQNRKIKSSSIAGALLIPHTC